MGAACGALRRRAMGERPDRVSESGAALRQRLPTSWVSRFPSSADSYFVGVQIPVLAFEVTDGGLGWFSFHHFKMHVSFRP